MSRKAGVPKGKFAFSVIDRARPHKAKGSAAAFNVTVKLLKGRKDLTKEQREEGLKILRHERSLFRHLPSNLRRMSHACCVLRVLRRMSAEFDIISGTRKERAA